MDKVQKTIVIEYKGASVVSKPFNFQAACIMDDCISRGDGFYTAAAAALKKMFEGTVVTDEVIDSELPIRVAKEARNRVLDLFLHVDDEVKN